MKRAGQYALGVDTMSEPPVVCVQQPWWETLAVVLGGLSSFFILMEMLRERGR